MIQHCQDALAINHYYHEADLFLTTTANPNWPEIKKNLLLGQTSSDRPDFIMCVFYTKMKQLLEDIHKHGVMRKTVV